MKAQSLVVILLVLVILAGCVTASPQQWWYSGDLCSVHTYHFQGKIDPLMSYSLLVCRDFDEHGRGQWVELVYSMVLPDEFLWVGGYANGQRINEISVQTDSGIVRDIQVDPYAGYKGSDPVPVPAVVHIPVDVDDLRTTTSLTIQYGTVWDIPPEGITAVRAFLAKPWAPAE